MTRRNRRPAADHPDLMAVLGLDTPPAEGMVDARPAREHARRLLDAKWGTRSIALRAQVSRHTVQALVKGRTTRDAPTRQVRPSTAARILEISLEEVPPCRPKHS
ncbi:hypothetical protein Q8791_23100 [Nocardiopsis sp. CT-R113]|uniref:Helix-turn-helix domain-containing protein n=1 Tax=Nocardiopsis codii TaxID=3065942 RepID=A0ABU7KDX1_9ACTN|nr:hypothetical protein [Nocardiopsis sp. CT-R113]MEE2040109.1 hypothetical protein [Nocardiopsis sp. CT-R113]